MLSRGYNCEVIFIMSFADDIYFDNLRQILSEGYSDSAMSVRPKWQDGTPAHTISIFGLVNRYDLAKEFPILTCRKINYVKAFDEVLWIYQKKSNNVHDLASHIWDSWADENGSIGKAYGYQIGVKSRYPEGDFDQMDRVLFDLKNNPASRRIMTNMYNHHDLSEMGLAPCAYSVTFNVEGDRLNAILNQRSQDMLVANGWNVCQYAFLLMLIAEVSRLKPGKLVHVIADAHIYDRHVDAIKELLKQPTYNAPVAKLEPIQDFYEATPSSLQLLDYQYSDFKPKFEVAV